MRVDAAASLAYVIERSAKRIETELGLHVVVNSGGSGALAQQVLAGDGADVYISADPAWMDLLIERGAVDTATLTDLVGNRLVVVGRADGSAALAHLADLSGEAYQPVAIGDPAYVPAGRYAAQALKAHGLELGVNVTTAEAPDVRAALAFVQSGECPTGIVYASDVQDESNVAVLFEIDPADHAPIRYPAAVVRDTTKRVEAMKLLAWLKGEEGRLVFESAGFSRVGTER